MNYHDVDVLLPVQKFLIDFSFSGKKPLDFVHSIMLRTLRLGPCSTEQLASFLNLDQNEITILLNDLLAKKEIKSTENDLFELSEISKRYFRSVSDIPQVEQISDRIVSVGYDLIGFDPIQSYENLGTNGIQITADQKQLSESEKIAKTTFQNNFYNYIEQGVLTFYQDHPQLYKVNKITKDRQLFNRVNLNLSLKLKSEQFTTDIGENNNWLTSLPNIQAHLASTFKRGSQSGKLIPDVDSFESCFNHLPSNHANLISMVKQTLQNKKVDNIHSIRDELENNTMFESLKLNNFLKRKKLNLNSLDQLEKNQILGPIYAPSNQEKFLNLLNRCTEEEKVQDLYWLTPTDAFFGESSNFKDLLNNLIASKSYNLKMFLPCTSLKNAPWENNHIERAQFSSGKFLALDERELFNSDFEVIVVKDKFCIVIAHIRDSEAPVLTSVPIGECILDVNFVNVFANIFAKSEQQVDQERGPCFGVIKAK
ncbi:hypothetical protein OW684_09730 [Acinetobacter baumannii]|uniref:hypothetical protein n=1 Tax=Acinetobacter baumannii TaxID=470 RepID=UPI00234092C2|nr:hypothetical protein [Acinetobacter baumannii]MDC4399553.1 hypothetical protein [Acinetobacter baumannii]MDK2106684.1 hypothetical protein [Acinetobacter baumannii]MDK2112019.1 hypothetical protein [Acinetobacter baumannii]MDK2141486.1 hypothetical protein [Acinetobacter baumannii]MDK2152400.1 hypothetical protein [Acinetobacter baumannii]